MKRIRNARFGWLEQRLQRLEDQGLRRRLSPIAASGMLLVTADGHPLINFGSNDYLGIAAERLDAQADARSGSGASPLVCGYSTAAAELCDALAALEDTEAAVLFPSGFAACSGTIAALAEPGDLILSDALNHASLIDGCRLSKAERFIYPHCDHAAVAGLLAAHRHRFQRAWIVTDTVFSMDGDLAPLAELVEAAERFDAIMIVDEAHATGVLGQHGSGACEAAGVKSQVPIRIGTLSKAIGSQGGFVAAPQAVTDYLVQQARPLIYSTAAAPAAIAAASAGLRTMQDQPQRRHRVRHQARRLRQRLGQAGFRIDLSEVPIVPLRIGPAAEAVRAADRLRQAGFFVPAIRPPTVPDATARLRISLSAAHTDQQIDDLCDAIERMVPPRLSR